MLADAADQVVQLDRRLLLLRLVCQHQVQRRYQADHVQLHAQAGPANTAGFSILTSVSDPYLFDKDSDPEILGCLPIRIMTKN